jgi:hypothetical protein
LHLATLSDAVKRVATPKATTSETTTKTKSNAATAGAPTAAAAPPSPLPCSPERTSTKASTPDHVPHAAAADALTACQAGWFVRAASAKDKWRTMTAAAASKTPAALNKQLPAPRSASASSTSNKSNAAKAEAAAPSDDASAVKASQNTSWLATALTAAQAKCGAACDSVTNSWRAPAAKASAALTPRGKAALKKGRSGKPDATAAPVPAGAALPVPAAGIDVASSPVPAACTDAAVVVSILAPLAPTPSSETGAAAAPKWRKNFGDRFRAALPHARSCRRTPASCPTGCIEARTATTAKPCCDAEAAAAAAARKRLIGATFAAKLGRLSLRRSPPDQAASAVAGVVGGKAAVAC